MCPLLPLSPLSQAIPCPGSTAPHRSSSAPLYDRMVHEKKRAALSDITSAALDDTTARHDARRKVRKARAPPPPVPRVSGHDSEPPDISAPHSEPSPAHSHTPNTEALHRGSEWCPRPTTRRRRRAACLRATGRLPRKRGRTTAHPSLPPLLLRRRRRFLLLLSLGRRTRSNRRGRRRWGWRRPPRSLGQS